jgi:hypothetical protein
VGVVDISVVDAYFGVEVCTPIFLGEASKINTNSDITPPNSLDMVTFEILLA